MVIVCEGWIPWRTKPTNREHQVANQGNPTFPVRVGFAHHTGDLRYTSPCPPPPASLCGVCTPCPEAQGHSSTTHTTHPCQGIFSNCSQTLYGICGEILSNSGESCSCIVSKGDDKLREVAQPPSILDSTAAQNASFATSPPLHLTNAGCPSEWLSPPAQPCSLLRFSLLPLGLEEPQPP